MISRLIDKFIDKLADIGGKARLAEMKLANIPEGEIEGFRGRIARIFAMKNPSSGELIALLHQEIGASGIANLAQNVDILENHARLAHYQRLKIGSLSLLTDIQKALAAHNPGISLQPWEAAYCIASIGLERWLPIEEIDPEIVTELAQDPVPA